MSTQLFATYTYADPDAAITLLGALGFTEVAIYRDEQDPAYVHHAEFAWRDNGGLMFGSAAREGDDAPFKQQPGTGKMYCVVAEDSDVDRVYAAALAAGCASVSEPTDEDYGGRGCGVRDPEGNLYSFGSYAGGRS